ncbi:MAG: LysR family transcriptional regulator [Pseudomonadales bacterium]|nr:LysR family transcriptional regulator [Pseudomonadales bacterium]
MSDIGINNIRKLDGSLLLVFRELLRTRNGSETAHRLSLSQSAISHNLTRLRDLFNDPLFVRKPHGFEPTRRALELGPMVEELMQVAARTLGDAGFDPATSDRTFLFAAPEYFTAQIGTGLANHFAAHAPAARFWCRYLPQQTVFAELRRGELDLAIGRFDVPAPAYIEVEPLYREQYCIALRRDHPVIRGRVGKRQVYDLAYVFAGSQSELTTGEIEADYSPFNMLAVVPQWLTALSIVATSDAATICPRRLAEQQARSLNLQVLKSPLGTPAFEVSLARRYGDRDAGITWLADAIRAITLKKR